MSVILPAAGRGARFAEGGGKGRKLEAELGGKAVLMRSVELFTGRPEVGEVIVAVAPEELAGFKFKWGDKLGFLGVRVVAGGEAERWETVGRALGEVSGESTHVAVHDAARPVTATETIDRVFEAAGRWEAVAPGFAVSETLKLVSEAPAESEEEADPLDAILGSAGKREVRGYAVERTVSRRGLWAIQTPQVFEAGLLREAYGRIASGEVETGEITDDAGLVEAMGRTVHVVEGDGLNVKITRPGDLSFAAAVVGMREGGSSEGLGPKRKFPTWAESEED